MRKALVIGCDGQDGHLLTKSLEKDGWGVVGVARKSLRGTIPSAPPVDICDAAAVAALVKECRPDEIYHLAAVHHSSEHAPCDPLELFRDSYAIHVLSLVHFLDAMRRHAPSARLFYAASSHIFGLPPMPIQDETTPINPRNVYGVTKASGLFACRLYRCEHSLFVSAGILYNHESPLRGPGFISRKIALGAAAAKRGSCEKLVLGNLSAEADWGYAPDYVEAMRAILEQPRPDDFVVATGERRTVRDFAAAAFSELGLDWRDHVVEDVGVLTKPHVPLVGDASKLRRTTGWRPRTDFPSMIRTLLQAETAAR
ncbi:MAG: GDP-mannose 4,6-dehydratase [Elusimicrobiota bacterium]|mgnify:CR=1 FL=1